jgi:hypothetical protein
MDDTDMSYEEFTALQMEPGPEQLGSPDMLGEPEPEPPTLRELAEHVHEIREALAKDRAELATLQALFNLQNEDLITEIRSDSEELARAEQELREATLARFKDSGDKKPGPGVSVRMVTKLSYEPTAAFDWAKQHDIALTLDTKAFEKLAKAGMAAEVATVTNEPQAIIATDLSKALLAEAE